MTLSANTLFHYTNTLDNLIGILANDFHPGFSLEDFNIINQESDSNPALEFAVPMVSFCDIPLSQVSQHFNLYGKYGIGLKKEWGIRNGISPVIYTYRRSRLSQRLYAMIAAINKQNKDRVDANLASNYFYDLLCYLKPYEGTPYHHGKYQKKIRYYDEREWRYVPKITLKSLRLGLSKGSFLNNQEKKRANDLLWEKYKLTFVPKDIKYIIVEKEEDIPVIIGAIRDMRNTTPVNDLEILISRIISADQILEDF
jgi:hypothetical protein